jgi:hypothetical protein
MSDTSYDGACFCGSVTFTVTGAPEGMGFCHCASCRSWSAAPVNAFTLWKPDSLTITRGDDHLATYHKTDQSLRKFCKACGGHVMTEHPDMGLVDIYAAMLPTLDFQPGLHVHYGEKVLSLPDGLPKFADLPGDLGGSGQVLPD